MTISSIIVEMTEREYTNLTALGIISSQAHDTSTKTMWEHISELHKPRMAEKIFPPLSTPAHPTISMELLRRPNRDLQV